MRHPAKNLPHEEAALKKLSILVPAYNEAKTLKRLVRKILAVPFPVDYEIIIIDDHSDDRTFLVAQALAGLDTARRIRLFRNETNYGKGYSIQRGLRYATGDIVVVQDADFEYDPAEIPRLLVPILERRALAVYGSRFLGRRIPSGMAPANWLANRFLTWATNKLYGVHLTDMETCYKLIRVDALEGVTLSAHRFDFEPEMTANLIKKGIEICELPIAYHGRTAAEGKKIRARDFWIALRVLFTHRFG